MKKLCRLEQKYSVDGGATWKTFYQSWNLLLLSDEEIEKEYALLTFSTYQSAIDYIKKNPNSFGTDFRVEKTLFGKERIWVNQYYNYDYYLIEKDCKQGILVEHKYIPENSSSFTIKDLATKLNADDFCEFLKERGIDKVIL